MFFKVWDEIQRNKGYFYACNGVKADEAMQAAWEHCLYNYDPDRGSLKFYVMSLGKSILKKKNKELAIDYGDNVIDNNHEIHVKDKDEDGNTTVRTYKLDAPDICDDVVRDIYADEYMYDEIAKIALVYMDMFLSMCKAIKLRSIDTKNYSTQFKKECVALCKVSPKFNKLCIDVYDKYSKLMTKFLESGEKKRNVWGEVDYDFMRKRQIKKVYLVDELGFPVIDADTQKYFLASKLKNKRIVRVNYVELWDDVCYCLEEDTISSIRFTIGSHTIYRTLGGSITVLDVPYNTVCDLMRMEILTNITKSLCGRILNIGSECIYLLCDINIEPFIPKISVAGFDIDLTVEVLYE